MTVLVTGARGFIGRSVARRLLELGETPVVLHHRWHGIEGLESLLPAGGVDGCIHLGWYANPRDYLVNVRENLKSLQDSIDLVEMLAARGCTDLVVAGSSAEYGPSDHLLSEIAPIAPWSVYGASKASLHQLLRSSLVPTDMVVSWARIFNVTGPGENPDRLLPRVARSVLSGRDLSLTLGTQIRDFSHVDDVADGLVQTLYASRPGAYNVSSGSGTPLSQVLTQLARKLGNPELLKFGELQRGEHDPDTVVGSNAALRGLGWHPKYDLPQLLASVASYWRTVSTEPSTLGSSS